MPVGVVTRFRTDLERGPKGGVVRRRRSMETPNGGEIPWIVVRVVEGWEFTVADDLAAIGFHTFAPHGVRIVRFARTGQGNNRKAVERDYAIFPGYVFLAEPAGLYVAKRSHPRILEVLSSDGFPCRIPAFWVGEVVKIWRTKKWHWKTVAAAQRERMGFRRGEEVKISGGPFVDFMGILKSLPKDAQAVIEVAIFGRPTNVTVPIQFIERG